MNNKKEVFGLCPPSPFLAPLAHSSWNLWKPLKWYVFVYMLMRWLVAGELLGGLKWGLVGRRINHVVSELGHPHPSSMEGRGAGGWISHKNRNLRIARAPEWITRRHPCARRVTHSNFMGQKRLSQDPTCPHPIHLFIWLSIASFKISL